jgi:hypothetical protein
VLYEDDDGCKYQFFKCAAPKGCESKTKGTTRYQTNKDGSKAGDRASMGNLTKHATKCWGKDVVKARMKGVEAQGTDGSIFSVFARASEHPVAASDRTLTEAELRCVTIPFFSTVLMTSSRAHIVRWVAESNRPLNIVEDREFRHILAAGRPEYSLPRRRIVARDLHAAYERSR